MIIQLTVGNTTWLYNLLVRTDDKGRYFVQLANPHSKPVARGPIVGGFNSLDWIVQNAAPIYEELLRHYNDYLATLPPPKKI